MIRKPGMALRGRKAAVIGLSAVVLFGGVQTALADVLTKNGGHLAQVGPVSAENGFPSWYKDDAGVKLALCDDVLDPMCIPADLPDPSVSQSFPANYPDESFYQLAGVGLDTATGSASAGFDLEAAFANEVAAPGDQMVFGRVRIRVDGLTIGETYKITHPYGVDSFKAVDDGKGGGEINYTEDIGITPGVFGEALNSRIGPFLKWDPAVAPAAPAGYIGDPSVEHPVVGSPFNTNVLRVEGPGIGAPGAANLCNPAAAVPTDCVETNLFTLQGKLATNGGVDVERATYSRDSDGEGMLDVFASTDNDAQSIEITASNVDPTRLRGADGEYAAHIAFQGAPPAEVTVTNVSDTPKSVKTAKVTDAVKARAIYNTDESTLVVNASSSDKVADPTLTAKDLGVIEGGSLTIENADAIPANVVVTSSAGGTTTIPVELTGQGFSAIPVAAFAGADIKALSARTVTLDGSGSTGPVQSYAWEQTAGPEVTLAGADTATPSFETPVVAEGETLLTFKLTVTGAGGPVDNTVDVIVAATAPMPVAAAGDDRSVTQGSVVTLDGSASTDTDTYRWRQTAGPAVILNGANTANPTFTFPKTPNSITFELTATGAAGSVTDTVVISGAPDVVTVGGARYRTGKTEWRIDGTSTVAGPGVSVRIYLGDPSLNRLIGTATVDALGAWTFRSDATRVAATNGSQITVVSSSGGSRTATVTVSR